ncbi:hypothetical protein CEXT_607111, partial [Caerostris extrusa]
VIRALCTSVHLRSIQYTCLMTVFYNLCDFQEQRMPVSDYVPDFNESNLSTYYRSVLGVPVRNEL